jgi:hypothetical protein
MMTAMPKETPRTWSSLPWLVAVVGGGDAAGATASGIGKVVSLMVCGCG